MSLYLLLLLYLLTRNDLLTSKQGFGIIFKNFPPALRTALAAFVLSWGYQNRVALGFYIMFSVLTIISFVTWFVSITGNGHAGLANAAHPTFTSLSVDESQASAHCHAVLETAESGRG